MASSSQVSPAEQPQPMLVVVDHPTMVTAEELLQRPAHLDDHSKHLVKALPDQHKSGHTLQAEIDKSRKELAHRNSKAMIQMKDRIDAASLVRSLVAPDEPVLLGGANIHFSKITYEAVDGTQYAFEKKLPGDRPGLLMVTNQRLLILSAEASSVCSVKPAKHKGAPEDPGCCLWRWCPAKPEELAAPKAYKVTAGVADLMRFYPMDLVDFTHASMSAETGAVGTDQLSKSVTCCCSCCSSEAAIGCMSRCMPCFTCCCSETWKTTPQISLGESNRRIQFYATLPPWNKPLIMVVHCNVETSLPLIKDFLVEIGRIIRLHRQDVASRTTTVLAK